MLVLYDNGTPRGVAGPLRGHKVATPDPLGATFFDGELLDDAEAAGFEVLLTTDKNLRYQQNLSIRKIAVVVLGKGRWRLIKPMLPQVAAAVNAATPGSYTEVEIPG
jgi:hypothetical protein